MAEQAALTGYNPYVLADRLGCMAPPMPEGYAEALAAWRKSRAKAVQQPLPTQLTLPGGSERFFFLSQTMLSIGIYGWSYLCMRIEEDSKAGLELT